LLYWRLIINGQIGESHLLRLEWASPLQDVRPRSWSWTVLLQQQGFSLN